jgi:putative glycosyltransferase (TIGR04372 family)
VYTAVTPVFRIRSLLCQNKDGWIRFILTLVLYSLLTIFVGYPLAVLQRISFSVLKLRICIFPTNYLGHFVFEADRYISLNLGTGYRTYFTTQPNIANSHFLKILAQRLKFFPRFIIVPIYLAQHSLPRNSKYILKIGSAGGLPDEVLVRRSNPWFSIDCLDNYPIKNKVHYHGKVKPIITFFLRDSDFRSELNNASTLRSSNYRDVTANNYIPLTKSLSSHFSIVKMGRGTKYRQDQDNKFWYNYSVSEDQSDFNDFLLAGSSDVCVTTDSGSITIPLLFRKRIVQTNLSLFGLINGPSSTFVTLKDYRYISSGKLLSFKELFELGIHTISDQKDFDLLGVEVIENSQEDLSQLAEEIEDLYSEIWRPNKLNQEVCLIIQKQFAANCPLPKDTYFANSWISNRPWFLIDLQI